MTAAARIHPDRPAVATTAISLALIVAAAAFAVSFASLSAIGTTLGLAAPWLVPVMLDGAILSATGLVLVERARGRRGVLPWAIIYGATAASSAANIAAHIDRDGLLAAAVAGAAPVVLLVLTHAISGVLVAEPAAPVATPVKPATVAAPVATPVKPVKPAKTAQVATPVKVAKATPVKPAKPSATRPEIAAAVAALLADPGRPLNAIAREYGVPRSTLQVARKRAAEARAATSAGPVAEQVSEASAETVAEQEQVASAAPVAAPVAEQEQVASAETSAETVAEQEQVAA